MKNLSLRPLIPLAAASALVAIGCGGKATDGVVGDGDGDGDQNNPPPSDPLSDENFNRSLDSGVDELCGHVQPCGMFGSHSECVDLFGELFERGYDTESRTCRQLLLDALACTNDTWRTCYDYSDECEEISNELGYECRTYDYDYDY